MKTLSYHTEKEIRVGITIVVFIMAVFATIKVRELQLSGTNYTEDMSTNRTELSLNKFSTMPLADARLIEEPIQASENQTNTAASVNEHELALQLKTWVNSGEYWSNENTENNEELTIQMTTWLKNGTYFKSGDAEELPTSSLENQSCTVKKGNRDINNPGEDLASQMKTWITRGDYWSIVND